MTSYTTFDWCVGLCARISSPPSSPSPSSPPAVPSPWCPPLTPLLLLFLGGEGVKDQGSISHTFLEQFVLVLGRLSLMPVKCHPLVFPGENKTAGLSSDADWWRALGAAPSRDQPHPSCPGTLKGSSFTESHTRVHFFEFGLGGR